MAEVRRWLPWFLVAGMILYGFSYWLGYMGSPLGIWPVLDARENLVWAERILNGTLPEEPFYRALGYPAVLAGLAALVGMENLPLSASFFGLLLHWLNAALVFGIAAAVWKQRTVAGFCALLYGFNPVALYFAVQLFDITLGMACFFGAVWCAALRQAQGREGELGDGRWEMGDGRWEMGDALRQAQDAGREMGDALRQAQDAGRETGDGGRWTEVGWYLLCGLLMGLAVVVRPHFLLPALGLPLWVICQQWVLRRGAEGYGWKRGLVSGGLIALPLILVLLAQGLVNLRVGGEFRILPWQGAYNFYAANKEGANGRYFVQRLYFDAIEEGSNPTRRESELLFAEATGVPATAETDIDALNAYWQEAAREEIFADIPRWLGLMGSKAVFLLNNWEQYNNFTYAFHRERSPLLQWNPIGWGLLLTASLLGCLVALRDPGRRPLTLLILFLAALYAGGVLLYFASARFRLPIVPLLAVGAGGIIPLGKELWQSRSKPLLAGSLAVLVTGLLITFPNWLQSRDRATFVQDAILLATAASRVGDDALALEQSEYALSLHPDRPDAIRLAMASRYNRILFGDLTPQPSDWERLQFLYERLPAADPPSAFIGGVAYWMRGEEEAAVQLWEQQVRLHGNAALSSAKALQVAGVQPFFEEADREMELLARLLNSGG